MTTVKKLIDIIQTALKKNLEIKVEPGTPGDQFGIYADYQKAFNELGWKPRVALEEDIIKMIRHYKS